MATRTLRLGLDLPIREWKGQPTQVPHGTLSDYYLDTRWECTQTKAPREETCMTKPVKNLACCNSPLQAVHSLSVSLPASHWTASLGFSVPKTDSKHRHARAPSSGSVRARPPANPAPRSEAKGGAHRQVRGASPEGL